MAAWPEALPFVPQLLVERAPGAPRHWESESTFVLLDFSGFTALSEQLARQGRVGAEDLVSTFTRLFTVLLSASDDGGDVVKFAGDAMLICYDGPDHQLHAAHAATAIQRLLKVVGVVHLVGARARLRMSVGIHSGRFELLLTGREHENLVVAGPALDRLLQLQDEAEPGQILISAEVAEALPPSAVGATHASGHLLGRVPPVESVGFLSRPGAPLAELSRYLPEAFSRRPDLLVADSDHRRAAMGFVQVSGLGPALESGRAAEAVDALTAVVEDACQQTGVTLLDTDICRDGFRYFVTAGAPITVEDPEGRLLRALVAITHADTELSVRAGAASGQVFAGAVGAPFRRTFSVMGDTTNLAARLTSRAPAGSLLVHAPVLARSRTLFATEEQPPVSVKGKAEPLPVALVTQVQGQRARAGDEPPFVGREAELATITGLMEPGGVLVSITGEQGVGKSRIARQAIAALGRPAIEITGDPYGAGVPFRTLGLLLRAVLGLGETDDPGEVVDRLHVATREHAPDLVSFLPLVGPMLGVTIDVTPEVDEIDERFRVARMHGVLGDLLTAFVDQPTVFLFDDAQWVDDASRDALTAVFADLIDRPWTVLLTRRESEAGLHASDSIPGAEVALDPFTDEESRSLVAVAGGPARRPADVAAVVDRAGGNPYFLLELAATAGAASGLPDSVEELVGLRIDDLPAYERDLLRQAAVLGSRFPAALMAETVNVHDFAELAREPALAEFLEIGDEEIVVFRRELQREVAYQQLTFRRRRDVHRRAAAAIQATGALAGGARLPLLSMHSFQAGDWPQAFRFSLEAAQEAQRAYANDDAGTFARRGIEAGQRSKASMAELRPLHLLLGEVSSLSGQLDDAVRSFGRARRGLEDPAEIASIMSRIALMHRQQHHTRATLAAARQVRALAARAPSPAREQWAAEADLLYAGVRYWEGRSADCRRLSLEAVAWAEQLEEGVVRTQLLARAYSLHDSAVVELEGKAGPYGELPVRMFEEIGDLYNQGRFCVNVAIGHYYEGRWNRAVEMYRESLDIAERTGDVFSVAVAQMNIGEVLGQQGQTDEAVDILSASVAALREQNSPLPAAHAACFLGAAQQVAGDLDDAAISLELARALFAEAGSTKGYGVEELATRWLEVRVHQGLLTEAVDEANQLLARGDALASPHRARAHRSAALALAGLGDNAAARHHIDESITIGRGLSLGYEAALSLLVLASSDPAERAAYKEAVAMLEALNVSDIDRVTPRWGPPASTMPA